MSTGFHLTAEGTAVLQTSGGATLHTVTFNEVGSGAVVTIYDNDAASGTEIAIIKPTAVGTLTYDVTLENGLTVVVATAACDITIGLA